MFATHEKPINEVDKNAVSLVCINSQCKGEVAVSRNLHD